MRTPQAHMATSHKPPGVSIPSASIQASKATSVQTSGKYSEHAACRKPPSSARACTMNCFIRGARAGGGEGAQHSTHTQWHNIWHTQCIFIAGMETRSGLGFRVLGWQSEKHHWPRFLLNLHHGSPWPRGPASRRHMCHRLPAGMHIYIDIIYILYYIYLNLNLYIYIAIDIFIYRSMYYSVFDITSHRCILFIVR